MKHRPSRRMRLLLNRRVERRKFRKWIGGEIRPVFVRADEVMSVGVTDDGVIHIEAKRNG